MDNGFQNRNYCLAGELAEAAGVSTDTLRHYERKGVLERPTRGHNRYRLYPQSALDRVLLVRRALSVGFTLDELARILGERDKGGAPCNEVRRLIAEKLSLVEEQLNSLAILREELRSTLKDWDQRLSKIAPDKQALLLENLAPSSAISETEKKLRFQIKMKGKINK